MTSKWEPTSEELDIAHRAMQDALRERIDLLAYDFSDYKAFFLSLKQESDRALPIVAFSYIDQHLRLMMTRAMHADIPGGPESLFAVFAPLGTASARISVAAGLRWLDPVTHHNLDRIRKIRNAFAHDLLVASFDLSPVRSHVEAMRPVEAPPWAASSRTLPPLESLTRRQLFHIRAALTTAHVLMALGTAPNALLMGLSPGAAFSDGVATWPKPFHDLVSDALRVMHSVASEDYDGS